MRLIIFSGIANYVNETIRHNIENDKISIKDDYLEATMEFFKQSGGLL